MPIHDWTRVDAGIFHDFHHTWITEIKLALNDGILPADYYALAEQVAGGFGPDVLTLQGKAETAQNDAASASGGTAVLAAPRLKPTAESDSAFYRRKQNRISVRHVSGDEVVAILEIVSPGNKAARKPLRAFVEKAAQFLDAGVHLLIADLFPPGRRDPNGIHAEIWQEIAGQDYALPGDRPLTLASYDAGTAVRAYVMPTAVGEALTDMPLFLEPGLAVTAPLEETYHAAFAGVPRRWQRVLLPA